MDNKRMLNYQFLKDLVTSHNIDTDDSELLAKTMNACYAFSRINFFDAYVRYDRYNSLTLTILLYNSLTLTILLYKKPDGVQMKEQIGISYEVSNNEPTATFCISDITLGTSTSGANYKVVGNAKIEYGTHDLFFNLFKNLPHEYWIMDRTEELLNKKFDEFSKWIVEEYSKGIENWLIDEYSPIVQEWLEKAAGRKHDYIPDSPGEDVELAAPEKQILNLI